MFLQLFLVGRIEHSISCKLSSNRVIGAKRSTEEGVGGLDREGEEVVQVVSETE